MEEEILTQEEDELEEDISDLEEEMKETTKPIMNKPKEPKVPKQQQEVNETYEGFMQPARLGVVNTINGEVIEGFEIGREEGIVQAVKAILNKLDKIAIASGV